MFRRLALSKLELAMSLSLYRDRKELSLGLSALIAFQNALDFEGEGWKKTSALPVTVQLQLCS